MSDAYIKKGTTIGLILDKKVAMKNLSFKAIDIEIEFNHIYDQETLVLKYGDTILVVPYEDIKEIITNE